MPAPGCGRRRRPALRVLASSAPFEPSRQLDRSVRGLGTFVPITCGPMFRATADDVPPLAAALARAFDDDPLMTWVFPRADTRAKRMAGLFALLLRTHHLRRGEVWAADR